MPEAKPARGRAWHTVLLALALVALLPVGYYLWQMRAGATPQDATAAVPETRTPRQAPSTLKAAPQTPAPPQNASTLKAPPRAPAQAQKPAEAAAAIPVGTETEKPAPVGPVAAGSAPANPTATPRPGPDPVEEALAADLDYPMDADGVTRPPPTDRPSGAAGQAVAPAVPPAPPPAAPIAQTPPARSAPVPPTARAQPTPASPEPRSAPAAATKPASPSGGPAAPIDSPRPNPAGKADALGAAPDSQKFRVTSIAVGPKTPTAIVNSQFVRVGDVVDGAKVVAITTYSVDLDIGGRRVTLRL